jgi:predicted metal-binding protein
LTGGSFTHRVLIFNPPAHPHVPQMSEKLKSLSRPTHWRQVLVVCRKCGKKLDGGFGAKHQESLKAVLRQAIRDSGRRWEVRVFETSCIGVCPKRGVTALNATNPGAIHVIPAGTPAEDAVRTLLGGDAIRQADGVEGP